MDAARFNSGECSYFCDTHDYRVNPVVDAVMRGEARHSGATLRRQCLEDTIVCSLARPTFGRPSARLSRPTAAAWIIPSIMDTHPGWVRPAVERRGIAGSAKGVRYTQASLRRRDAGDGPSRTASLLRPGPACSVGTGMGDGIVSRTGMTGQGTRSARSTSFVNGTRITRRQVLKGAAAMGAVTALGPLASACGGDDTSTEPSAVRGGHAQQGRRPHGRHRRRLGQGHGRPAHSARSSPTSPSSTSCTTASPPGTST